MPRTKRFADLVAEARQDSERRARIAQHRSALEAALALTELRGSIGMTQQAVADSLEMSQANVSRIEHEDDLYLSTLRSYVAALGGELRLTAVFPDRTVSLEPGKAGASAAAS